ncbi:MAG TPA: potassium/proton antiporter [Anaeromyxobacteraceae bacterium]|nr:potassium/proton antiporter [Anaeromyxobacteraceae bacterium]
MPSGEPFATALLISTAGALLAASVLFSGATRRLGMPVGLVFVGIGILAGAEGVGGLRFEDYAFAWRLGSVALALILFDGGLNTPLDSLRAAIAPAAVLATAGVLATAAAMGSAAHLLGLPWGEALLLGAVVSSTDSAAVFSILRSSGIQLRRRVGATLELESGLNDPTAVILTAALTDLLVAGRPLGPSAAVGLVAKLALGAAAGGAIGWAGRWLLSRVRLPVGGLYPVLTTALALLAFGVPELVGGSGFLSVFLAAVLIGNGPIPFRGGVLRAHDAGAWFLQVSMFLVLGLLASPSRLLATGLVGLGLAFFLLLARPLVVVPLLLPFRYRWTEMAYVGWVGLRGAVPIVLAIVPVLARAPGADRIFDVVFFVVLVNILVQGLTVRRGARRLRLQTARPPPPQGLIEISPSRPLDAAIEVYFVDPASAVAGSTLAELPPFPAGSSVLMVLRGDDLLAARGSTALVPGDHVYLLTRPEDRAFVRLCFGEAEEA